MLDQRTLARIFDRFRNVLQPGGEVLAALKATATTDQQRTSRHKLKHMHEATNKQ
jgi:hypothetical protein